MICHSYVSLPEGGSGRFILILFTIKKTWDLHGPAWPWLWRVSRCRSRRWWAASGVTGELGKPQVLLKDVRKWRRWSNMCILLFHRRWMFLMIFWFLPFPCTMFRQGLRGKAYPWSIASAQILEQRSCCTRSLRSQAWFDEQSHTYLAACLFRKQYHFYRVCYTSTAISAQLCTV